MKKYILIISLLLTKSLALPSPKWLKTSAASSLYPDSALNPAHVIQVTGPPPDYGPIIHTEVLAQNTFANSSNAPFKTSYKPPLKPFTRVTLTLMTKIQGIQYDRLVHIFLGDSEIWRSSTPEPGDHNITSSFTKDVSQYIGLFNSTQNLTIQLDNVITDYLNGEIGVTLIARYYYPEKDSDHGKGPTRVYEGEGDLLWQQYSNQIPPSKIEPITSDIDSLYWITPPLVITKHIDAMPRNVTRAVLEISATGTGDDEFWYSNIFDDFAKPVAGIDSGTGPARVIEVLINNRIAGIIFPYPVIFAGGISPYMWSPIVSIHAFDTPTYQIDISPFLPALWAGMTKLDIRVTNGYNSTQIKSGWIVNANIITWETPVVVGNGYMEINNSSIPNEDLDTKSVGGFSPSNSSAFEVVSLLRGLSRVANLDFNGNKIRVEWQQACMFDNIQYLSTRYDFHSIAQSTLCAANMTLSRPGNDGPSRLRSWQKMYQYPLSIQATYNSIQGKIENEIAQGYEHTDSNTGAIVATTQNATATTFDEPFDSSGRMGFGSNRQFYYYQDRDKIYKRLAGAYNNTLVIDTDTRNGSMGMDNFISMTTLGLELKSGSSSGPRPGPLSVKGDDIHLLSKKYFDNQHTDKRNGWTVQYLAEVNNSLFKQRVMSDNDKVKSNAKREIGSKHRPLISRNKLRRGGNIG